MAEAGFRARWIGRLKRLGPAYRFAARTRRAAREGSFNVLRRSLPPWPRVGPAKGLFSAVEELRAGKLPGELLLERQECPPVPSGSLRLLARLGQEGHQPWPVFWTQHRNARLLGGAALLVDEHKRACAESVFLQQQDGDPGYYTLWLPAPLRLPGNWTSVLSRWSLDLNFYHWLTDCLPRLALLDRLPPDTRVLVPATLRGYHTDTLRWLGLEHRIRPVTEPHLVAENYFFSAPTAMTGCASPYAVKFLREQFLPRADAAFPVSEKIYIQRRGKTRGILNEPEVRAFLEQRGWRSVDLENLSLAQQIRLFSGARAVCGPHGAGFTNLLWCRPGCVAVELLADNFLNGAYESIAESVGVEHRFLIHEADRESRIRVDLDRLGRVLPG